jgi:hypothetical protein
VQPCQEKVGHGFKECGFLQDSRREAGFRQGLAELQEHADPGGLQPRIARRNGPVPALL